MPDSLYAVGLLGAAAALGACRGADDLNGERRLAGWALVAQLCRYPGLVVVMMMSVAARRPWAAARAAALVAAVAAGFGIAGAVTGELSGWVETVSWETGPEHWHGEYDPSVLLARIPDFFWLWLCAAGGTPLLAAVRWPPGTRICLGAAVAYALVLGTIDHSPSHYLVPLVWLSVVALGASVSALRTGPAHLLSALGLLGLWTFSVFGLVT